MTITVLSDVIFPQRVLVAGLNGSNTRRNDRSKNPAGYASVNAVSDWTAHSWQVATQPMLLVDAQALIAINEITDYGAFGFLLEDPIDRSVTLADGALQGYMSGVEFGTTGYGNGTPLYGFRKLYRAAGSTRFKAREITRQKGVWSLFRGGSPVTVGVAAGNVSLSAGPTYATFVPDATRTVSAVTVGATTQVTLSSAIGVVIGGRLWLQGLTGADAALLNNQSHQVTNIAGAVYTLATSTAGKTITAGSGQGHKYPQPDEALTWSGDFYVPVQFRDDNLDWQLDAPGPYAARLVSIPATYIDEIREA